MTKSETASDTQQGIDILVADDYEINQKLTRLILHSAGYHVEIVENGQQAFDTYQQNHFHLILMDIHMPVMDGYEATKEIRNWEEKTQNKIGKTSEPISETPIPNSNFHPIPIIAMTGDAVESVADICRQKGMNGCIGKPLQRDKLLSVVQEWTNTGSNPPERKAEKENVGPSS